MKNSKEIMTECRPLHKPNEGIIALAQKATVDSNFCIIDMGFDTSFRCVCFDNESCCNPEFMLACLQTKEYIDGIYLKEDAINIYNKAMENRFFKGQLPYTK